MSAAPHRPLENLLGQLFEPDELRRFLLGLGGSWAKLVVDLPFGVATKAEVVFQASTKLISWGLADRTFFAAMEQERPGRAADIVAEERTLRGSAGSEPREEPPQPHPASARRDALDSYRAALRRRVEDMPWLSRQLGLTKTLSEVCVRVEVCETHLYSGSSWSERGPRASAEHMRLQEVLGPAGARWVMLGEPGSGKSTLLRRLALDLAEGEAWLPVLLHASDLREHELHEAVRNVWGKNAAEVVAAWPADRLAVLMDGLDEAGSPREVARVLQGRADDLGMVTLIIAGRPEGQLDPWPGFGTLQILPLAEGEQERLLAGLGVAEAAAKPALARLRSDRRLREIAARPLLLTLAALVLKQDGALPDKRARLYARALDCMLHRAELNPHAPHETVRAPESVEAALVYLAPRLLARGEGPWSRSSVLSDLRGNTALMNALRDTWPENTADAFLNETGRTVGILVPQGQGVGFPHRTLGEYLASRGLVEDPEARELAIQSGLKNPAAWAEVLALTTGQIAVADGDAMIRRIAAAWDPGRALLHRVLADAEGLSSETVLAVLGVVRGWRRWKERQQIIQEIPALVGDVGVAVRLLDRLRRETRDGNDLYWIRETLRGVAATEGVDADAARDATETVSRIFDHIPAADLEKAKALLGPQWRTVPPEGERLGPYKVGSEEYNSAKPIHDVTLTARLSMLAVPVTWEMYLRLDPGHVEAQEEFGGRLRKGEAQAQVPVYNVTWYAATMFAAWVGARLPAEAEWELACRAGTTTQYWSGNQESDLARVGWYRKNSDGHPHPVGQKPANPWGLHDVHGNVWEWCLDWYQDHAYASRRAGLTVDPAGKEGPTYAVGGSPPVSAESAARGDDRVLRGGSWSLTPGGARSAFRIVGLPSSTNSYWGFRLVLPVAVPEPG